MESEPFEIESFEPSFKTPIYRIFSSLGVLLYIWLLPVLSNTGFTEKMQQLFLVL